MFAWLKALSYAQYVPYVTLIVAFLVLGGWGVGRVRTWLIARVRKGLLEANEALAYRVKKLTIPAAKYDVFEQKRAAVQDLLTNMQGVVLTAEGRGWSLGLPRELFNLCGSLWTLRRFQDGVLLRFRTESAALVWDWITDVRRKAEEKCAEAEARVFKEETMYRALEADYANILTLFSLVRLRLKQEHARDVDASKGVPTNAQVLAYEALEQLVAQLWVQVENPPSRTSNQSGSGPAPERKITWLYH